jgi:hypothetical protein
MDALSLVFGVPAFDLPGLTFPDWTPSQASVRMLCKTLQGVGE